MLTEEEYRSIFEYIDQTLETRELHPDQTIAEEVVEDCVDEYNTIKYGKNLPIKWVTDFDKDCTEFYTSEENLSWLLTMISYWKNTEDYSEDLHEISLRCLLMATILLFVDGINTIDGVTYLLKKDTQLSKRFKVKTLKFG